MPTASLKARRLLSRFEKASDELSWIGSKHPDDAPGIKKEYVSAKQALLVYIEGLETAVEFLSKRDDTPEPPLIARLAK